MQRQVSHLIEKQRPGVRFFEQPRFCVLRVGEGALLVAEQLAFEQGWWNGCAIHGHERSRPSGTAFMKRPGQHLFSRARISVDQHRHVAVGKHPCGLRKRFAKGLALTDHLAEDVDAIRWLGRSQRSLSRRFHSCRQRTTKQIQITGESEVVGSSSPHGLDGEPM
jgi:hypothetical protein